MLCGTTSTYDIKGYQGQMRVFVIGALQTTCSTNKPTTCIDLCCDRTKNKTICGVTWQNLHLEGIVTWRSCRITVVSGVCQWRRVNRTSSFPNQNEYKGLLLSNCSKARYNEKQNNRRQTKRKQLFVSRIRLQLASPRGKPYQSSSEVIEHIVHHTGLWFFQTRSS